MQFDASEGLHSLFSSSHARSHEGNIEAQININITVISKLEVCDTREYGTRTVEHRMQRDRGLPTMLSPSGGSSSLLLTFKQLQPHATTASHKDSS